MKKKMRDFDRTLFWRDGRELVAGAVVFVAFLFIFLRSHSTLSGAGCVVIMASCIFIAGELFFSRRKHPAASETAPLSDYLRAELVKVKWQAKLLRMVWLWYLLPLFIGVELFELGFPEGLAGELFSLVFNLAIFGVIYWLNLYAVRKSLLPLQKELEDTLASVSESSPSANG
ncbi:MAG TPA: hypothetical protein VFB72_18050 [Verrucomicrobiae bacterium]|nr:hypothetical protein [Verrucomicrobiae bacterium]